MVYLLNEKMAILNVILDLWFTIKSKLIPQQNKCEPKNDLHNF